jgi:hypothetical protein
LSKKNPPMVASFTLSYYYEGMKKTKPDKKKAEAAKKPASPPLQPLPILEDEQESLDQEMQDLFNEDKVTHRHGSAEPESD